MRCKPRTLLPVTTFMRITLNLMNACRAGTTGSGTVTDTAAQAQSATTDSDAADDIAAQTVSDGENTRHITILATSDMHANVMSYSYEDNTETEKEDGTAAEDQRRDRSCKHFQDQLLIVLWYPSFRMV